MTSAINRNISKTVGLCAAVVLTAALFYAPLAKTRWSALQLVPGADMLAEGRFVVDADVMWGLDDFDIASPTSTQRVHFGLTEWVNLDLGYADGFTMGFKANLVREARESMVPALTLGMQNLFSSRDAAVLGAGNDFPVNEFYLVAAKTSEWAKLRVHAGFMSAADFGSGRDRFNPFVGMEKYLGQRLFMTLEAQRRDAQLLLSVFTAYRVVNDKVELSLGVIDAPGIGRSKSPDPRIVNPVLRAGLRVHIGNGYNTFDGVTGVEDRLDRYRDTLVTLGRRIDSLNTEMRWTAQQVHALSGVPDERRQERARVVEELTKLRNMYDQEPFDPELVKSAKDRFLDRKDAHLPHLRVIITDTEISVRIRTLAVTLLGDMGDNASSELLISMLSRFEEPQLKTEIIITLGKMRETRARSILEKMRGDPDSGVSFAATEVYNSLFGSDAEKATPPSDEVVWPLGDDPTENTIPERRIGR